jgi:hypothetical protein
MGRAVNPPVSTELALLVALGFGACMPSEVEVGRDATLEVVAGVGGRAGLGRSGEAGDSGMEGGSDGDARAGGATSSAGSSASRGGRGGGAGTRAGQGGGGASAGAATGVAGASVGAAGGPLVASGGTGGGTSTIEYVCPVPGSQEAAWTLEMFCSAFTCPTSADGAKDLLARSFEGCPGVANEVRTGCGLAQISVTTESLSDSYVYAEETRELVGAAIHADKPWGPCNVFRYHAGIMPSGCQGTTACVFCGAMATCP